MTFVSSELLVSFARCKGGMRGTRYHIGTKYGTARVASGPDRGVPQRVLVATDLQYVMLQLLRVL